MKPIMRGRRRSLAVPFVMTAAFAPGCVVQSGPPAPSHARSAPAGQASHGRVIANPPPPATAAPSHQQPQARPVEATRAEPKNWPPPPAGADGKVMTREDGSCWFVYAMPECPEGVACNPPRPKRVACAEKDEPEGRIVRSDDGTCWFHYTVDADACPQKAVCNPPPPKKVDCPEP